MATHVPVLARALDGIDRNDIVFACGWADRLPTLPAGYAPMLGPPCSGNLFRRTLAGSAQSSDPTYGASLLTAASGADGSRSVPLGDGSTKEHYQINGADTSFYRPGLGDPYCFAGVFNQTSAPSNAPQFFGTTNGSSGSYFGHELRFTKSNGSYPSTPGDHARIFSRLLCPGGTLVCRSGSAAALNSGTVAFVVQGVFEGYDGATSATTCEAYVNGTELAMAYEHTGTVSAGPDYDSGSGWGTRYGAFGAGERPVIGSGGPWFMLNRLMTSDEIDNFFAATSSQVAWVNPRKTVGQGSAAYWPTKDLMPSATGATCEITAEVGGVYSVCPVFREDEDYDGDPNAKHEWSFTVDGGSAITRTFDPFTWGRNDDYADDARDVELTAGNHTIVVTPDTNQRMVGIKIAGPSKALGVPIHFNASGFTTEKGELIVSGIQSGRKQMHAAGTTRYGEVITGDADLQDDHDTTSITQLSDGTLLAFAGDRENAGQSDTIPSTSQEDASQNTGYDHISVINGIPLVACRAGNVNLVILDQDGDLDGAFDQSDFWAKPGDGADSPRLYLDLMRGRGIQSAREHGGAEDYGALKFRVFRNIDDAGEPNRVPTSAHVGIYDPANTTLYSLNGDQMGANPTSRGTNGTPRMSGDSDDLMAAIASGGSLLHGNLGGDSDQEESCFDAIFDLRNFDPSGPTAGECVAVSRLIDFSDDSVTWNLYHHNGTTLRTNAIPSLPDSAVEDFAVLTWGPGGPASGKLFLMRGYNPAGYERNAASSSGLLVANDVGVDNRFNYWWRGATRLRIDEVTDWDTASASFELVEDRAISNATAGDIDLLAFVHPTEDPAVFVHVWMYGAGHAQSRDFDAQGMRMTAAGTLEAFELDSQFSLGGFRSRARSRAR
jgi:hypothetical protein